MSLRELHSGSIGEKGQEEHRSTGTVNSPPGPAGQVPGERAQILMGENKLTFFFVALSLLIATLLVIRAIRIGSRLSVCVPGERAQV